METRKTETAEEEEISIGGIKMEKGARSAISLVLVIGIVYCLLGLVGFLPAQYDATKGFKTNAYAPMLKQYEMTIKDAAPALMALDSHENIWFTSEQQGGQVYKMTPDGQFTTRYIPLADTFDIKIDGNTAWITDYGNTSLVKINLNDWTHNTYKVPISKYVTNTFIIGLDLDSNGNVWICNGGYPNGGRTPSCDGSIYKFNPSTEQFVEYPVESDMHPFFINVDSNDDIVIQSINDELTQFTLYKMHNNGVFTSKKVVIQTDTNPVSHLFLSRIDFDDNIWYGGSYTETLGNGMTRHRDFIGKVSTNFILTKYDLPIKAYFSNIISVSPYKNDVWFTEVSTATVGRFNKSSHLFEEYKLADNSHAFVDIIIDSDSNIYITDRLGRYDSYDSIDKITIVEIEEPNYQPFSVEAPNTSPTIMDKMFDTLAQSQGNTQPSSAPILNNSQIIYLVATIILVAIAIIVNKPQKWTSVKKSEWKRK